MVGFFEGASYFFLPLKIYTIYLKMWNLSSSSLLPLSSSCVSIITGDEEDDGFFFVEPSSLSLSAQAEAESFVFEGERRS